MGTRMCGTARPSSAHTNISMEGGTYQAGSLSNSQQQLPIVEHVVAYFGQFSATPRCVSRKMTICIQVFHGMLVFGMCYRLFLFRYVVSSLLVCQSSVRRYEARIRALGIVRSTSCTTRYLFVTSGRSSSGASSGVEGLQRLQTSRISMCRSKGSQHTPHNIGY